MKRDRPALVGLGVSSGDLSTVMCGRRDRAIKGRGFTVGTMTPRTSIEENVRALVPLAAGYFVPVGACPGGGAITYGRASFICHLPPALAMMANT